MLRRGTRSAWSLVFGVFLGNRIVNLSKTSHRNILAALSQPVQFVHDLTDFESRSCFDSVLSRMDPILKKKIDSSNS